MPNLSPSPPPPLHCFLLDDYPINGRYSPFLITLPFLNSLQPNTLCLRLLIICFCFHQLLFTTFPPFLPTFSFLLSKYANTRTENLHIYFSWFSLFSLVENKKEAVFNQNHLFLQQLYLANTLDKQVKELTLTNTFRKRAMAPVQIQAFPFQLRMPHLSYAPLNHGIRQDFDNL